MRTGELYRKYPKRGVENLGAREGYFDNLDMYCGLAFDRSKDTSALCDDEASGGLFVWSEEAVNELKNRGRDLKKLQLDTVAYLWELFYDVLLGKNDNVSVSPGFEALGLRVNNRKRKLED